jgi:hypothetical protein
MNRDIILERLSGKLYHFTCLESLIEIINSNWTFELSSSDNEEREYIRHGKEYFISFTRQKDYRVGFPGSVYDLVYDSIVVRIEFNGDLLNNNFEGHAVDYFKGAKHEYFKRRIFDKYHFDVESEDRLLSNKPTIERIDRYINRIDILCSDEEDFEEWSGEISLLLTKSNMIYVYDNGNDFMKQNNNTINRFLLNNMAKVQISENDIRYMVNECINKILLREIRRMTDYFIVEKMLKTPISIDMDKITNHFNDRGNRVERINKKINDFGEPVYSFIVNCGHMNGKEVHTITEKGIIIIQNLITKNIITILIARPGQIVRYWKGLNQELPQNDDRFKLIMRFCKLNQELGHNKY